MPVKLGIGITTFNRRAKLEKCISDVQRFTDQPFRLVIADDGSTDGTEIVCARVGVPLICGRNMGIAWNKNRALCFLHKVVDCDVIILLEDDTHPNHTGWQNDWVAGAKKWGHVNFGGFWFGASSVSGTGEIASPLLSPFLSGQCAAFSREALLVCGFMDPRFKAYGYEHAEHSARLVRAGFGGEMRMTERGQLDPHFYQLAADLTVASDESYRDEESMAANWIAWTRMYRDPVYRLPWRTTAELLQLWREIRNAARGASFSLRQRIALDAAFLRDFAAHLRRCRRSAAA